jgi:bifunctional non-homologous end joining protein LigD
MADIAGGRGRAPKPFMTRSASRQAAPNAVWDTSVGLAPALRAKRKKKEADKAEEAAPVRKAAKPPRATAKKLLKS